MRKRFVTTILFCTIAALCAFGFAACGNDGKKSVAVESVTLNKTELSLKAGEEESLTATVAPENATDRTVSWTSDHPDIATVENGKVTAVAAGTATVTAKADNASATCAVTVTPAAYVKMTQEEWIAAIDATLGATNVTVRSDSPELSTDGEMLTISCFDWKNDVLAYLDHPGQTEWSYILFTEEGDYDCSYYEGWNVYSLSRTKEECFAEWMEVLFTECVGISDIAKLKNAYGSCTFDETTGIYTCSFISYDAETEAKLRFQDGKISEISVLWDGVSALTKFVDYGTTVVTLPAEVRTAIDNYTPQGE